MSQERSAALKIVVSTTSNQDYRGALEGLGHEVLGYYPSTPDLLQALTTLSVVSDLIITDAIEGQELRKIQQQCESKKLNIPLIIVSQNLHQLQDCDELTFVFGICSELQENSLRAVIFVAMARFEAETKWRLKAEEAEKESERAKIIHRACSILYDHKLVDGMIAAYRYLQEISASYARPMHEQAALIIKADETMHPKRRKKRSGK